MERGIEMLNASEALAITKKHDKYAEQMGMIEQEIQNAAKRGESYTWWHCENMNDYEQKILVKRLEEFGYFISVRVNDDIIYISWSEARKE